MKKLLRALLHWWIVSMAMLLFAQDSIASASETITLSFYPDSIALLPGENLTGLVIVENNSKQPIRKMKLASFTEVGVKVSVAFPDKQFLAPSGSLSWTYMVTRLYEGLSEGDVFFRLEFQQITGKTDDDLVPGVVIGKLAVKERIYTAIELSTIANLQIDTNIEKLIEKRPGKIFVSVANKSSRIINIAELRTQAPGFVSVDKITIDQPIELKPYNTKVFPLSVAIRDHVQPGKHYLFIEVDIAWQQKGQLYEATLTSAKEFVASVLGESDIMQIFKIPSLLFLPGFLILTMFLWLWKFSPKAPELMKASDPEFWMFSILLSFITAVVYPAITHLLGEKRNFIEAYGFRDIANIWIFSLIFATFLWILIALAIKGYRNYKAEKIAEYIFNDKDNELVTLRKLERNNMSLELERGEFKNQTLYKLQEPENGKFLAAPAIKIAWEVDFTDSDRKKYLELSEHLSERTPIIEMVNLLHSSVVNKKVKLTWETGDGPKLVGIDEWRPHTQEPNGQIIQSSIIIEQ